MTTITKQKAESLLLLLMLFLSIVLFACAINARAKEATSGRLGKAVTSFDAANCGSPTPDPGQEPDGSEAIPKPIKW